MTYTCQSFIVSSVGSCQRSVNWKYQAVFLFITSVNSSHLLKLQQNRRALEEWQRLLEKQKKYFKVRIFYFLRHVQPFHVFLNSFLNFVFFLFLAPEILFSFEAIIQNLENVKNICLLRDYKAFPAFNLKDWERHTWSKTMMTAQVPVYALSYKWTRRNSKIS